MKWYQEEEGSPRSPKAHQKDTKFIPKRAKIPKTWESYEPEANIDWTGITTETSSNTRIGKTVK